MSMLGFSAIKNKIVDFVIREYQLGIDRHIISMPGLSVVTHKIVDFVIREHQHGVDRHILEQHTQEVLDNYFEELRQSALWSGLYRVAVIVTTAVANLVGVIILYESFHKTIASLWKNARKR